MNNRNNHLIMSALLLCTVALNACSAPPAPPSATPSPAPTAVPTAAAKFPTGKFVNESDPARGMLFNADGTWAGYFGGIDPVVEGTYGVEGDLYTETSNSDTKCPYPATYRWHFDGVKLTFELVGEDPCTPRRAAYGSILLRP